MRVQTLGDLVLQGVGDPGRLPQYDSQPFTADDGSAYARGSNSWFSLWRPSSAVELLSAGGNLVPIQAG